MIIVGAKQKMDEVHPSILEKIFNDVINLVIWVFMIFMQGYGLYYVEMGRQWELVQMKNLCLDYTQDIIKNAITQAIIKIYGNVLFIEIEIAHW